eukprot:TRINITY_DN14284_c0_g1_i1.p1 TRINITY_DN14284_c0_g1~~TRINITY_DN14284_c0_g1_i1.p1  ORF type:complete len:122 (-),score=17.90 TRINITY_DN14284_c0_g1_i1:99-434(-)
MSREEFSHAARLYQDDDGSFYAAFPAFRDIHLAADDLPSLERVIKRDLPSLLYQLSEIMKWPLHDMLSQERFIIEHVSDRTVDFGPFDGQYHRILNVRIVTCSGTIVDVSL